MFGEAGRFPGQFAYPRALDTYGNSVIVVDKSARIQRLHATTGAFLGGWRMPEWAMGKPTGLTVAAHPFKVGAKALWVADTHYHRVMVYDLPSDPMLQTGQEITEPAPEPILRFGGYGEAGGEFVYLTDVAVLPSDDPAQPIARVYVSEYGGNDRISVFEPDGAGGMAFRFEFGSQGPGSGVPGQRDGVEFHRPQSMALVPERGELLVVDSGNHRIGRFTLDGALIGWIGGPGVSWDEPGTFRYPYGIAVLDDDTALVCEYGGCRVRHIAPWSGPEPGAWLGDYGVPGVNRGEFSSPWALAVEGDTVFVLDSGNSRVQAFRGPARGRAAAAGASGVRGVRP